MNSHEWFIEHRTAFVVRSLERPEEKSFTEHLAGCGACRAEIARIERDLAWLPMAVAPVAPRPGLRRELIEAVLGGGRRRVQWLVPLGAAASLTLALGFWGWQHQRAAALSAEIADLRRQLGAIQDTLSIIRGAGRVLQASIKMDGHQGGLMIFADQRSHRWNVVVHGLPAAHPGEVYQFWFICENGMVRSVQVHVDESNPAFMTLTMPVVGGEVRGAALTVEPAARISAEPTGKELAHLML